MPLEVIDTVKKGFSFLAKDPGLIALFAIPSIGGIPLAFTIGGISAKSITSIFSMSLSIIGCGIISFLLGIWVEAAAILKVNELNRGRKLSFVNSLKKGLGKFPRLLAATILMVLIMLAIFSPIAFTWLTIAQKIAPAVKTGAIPAAPTFAFFPWLLLLIPICLIVGFYVDVRLALYPQACVLENILGFKTSWNLLRGQWWRLFGILLIFTIISGLLGLISGLLGLIPYIGNILVTLFITPAMVASLTLAYFSLKK